MVKNFDGEGAKTRDLYQIPILTAFFRLSQCLGKVTAWYYWPKSEPVCSSHHNMIWCDFDQDLDLFWPKQQRPHCLAYSTKLRMPGLYFSLYLLSLLLNLK